MELVKNLDAVEVFDFNNSLLLAISKKWLFVLIEPIIFQAKIENGELVLSTPLKVSRTSSKKEVITNEM